VATIAYPGNLQTAQTGNADSTNTIRRLNVLQDRKPILRIVSTIGATPTVTVNILGSYDGTTFFNVMYSPYAAAPTQFVNTALTITTAITQLFYLPDTDWVYLKLNMSANTNVTLTSDLL
jgi:hypothetical protein